MVITTVVLGAGDRGTVYGKYALSHPDQISIIAVADQHAKRRVRFAQTHQIGTDNQYSDWSRVFTGDKIADAVIITLPDKLHYPAAKQAIELGYHVLLEKPMATSAEQVKELSEMASKSSMVFQVCHVLRYTPFYRKIKEICSNGRLGKIITIIMRENVSYYHYAHSYIRGNWHNRDDTAPMILTKSSHDLDLMYWLADSKPSQISSFGSLNYFGSEYRPEGSPDRCTDGCPVADTCLYYAPRIYLDILPLLHGQMQNSSVLNRWMTKLAINFPKLKRIPPFDRINKYQGWPVNVITDEPTLENRRRALETGPYGRCVYDIDDHNVVDNQVVNVEFDSGLTVNFSLHGHSSEEGRDIRIDGTRGTLVGEFSFRGNFLTVIDSLTNKKEVLIDGVTHDNHGGGDHGIISDFIANINSGNQPDTRAAVSLISHLMAFAADESRLNRETIDFDQYLRSI